MRILKLCGALMLGATAATVPAVTAPATAAVSQANPAAFVESLTEDGLAALRSGSEAQRRARFADLLGEHFAIETIGDQLIRRWRSRISDAQYTAYRRALPGFIMGTYADRLSSYARADIRVGSTRRSGSTYLVASQVSNPGSQPVTAIWYLTRQGGEYKVYNLRVAGINLTLNQRADFDSYIQRNGFDQLVQFMERRGA